MPVTEIPVKTALRKGLLPDAFTSSLSALSPYRGCGHGCLYCDGRSEKYYVTGDFSQDIGVRAELPALLKAELPRLREQDRQGRKPLVSVGSGVTDVYQPLERSRKVTRACAEILVEAAQPCLVITKSSLVLRDLDLWTRNPAGFVLVMTVAQDDDRIRRRFEPGASSLEERWETLAAFRSAGAAVGILAMPLLPGISDGEGTLRALLEKASSAGVDFFLPGGLTLRPGVQKSLYLKAVGESFPEHLARYEGMYAEERPSGAPKTAESTALGTMIRRVSREFNLPPHLPHRVLADRVPVYEALYLLLVQMESLFQDRHEDLPRLKSARERFGTWLSTRRTTFRRHRTFEPTWIEGEFLDLLSPGQLEVLFGNDKLAAFARSVARGAVFDPVTRKLGDPA